MRATDIIRISLENSQNWIMGLLQDISDAPLTQPTATGGNHPLWIVGHLALSESQILDGFVLGHAARYADMEPLFGMGSTPVPEAAKYPPLSELVEKFSAMRAATLAHLATLSEDDLDQRSHAPEEYGPFFATVGACYTMLTIHVAFHGGQIADARRAAGRKPLMA